MKSLRAKGSCNADRVDGGQARDGRGLFKRNDARFARCTRLENAISLGLVRKLGATIKCPPYPSTQNPPAFLTCLFHRRGWSLSTRVRNPSTASPRSRYTGKTSWKKRRLKCHDGRPMIPSAFLPRFIFVRGNNDDATLCCPLFHRVCFHVPERRRGGEVSLKIYVY